MEAATVTPQDHLADAANSADDARRLLIEAMRSADAAGSARVHLHLTAAVAAIDDARAALTEVAE